MSTKLSVCVFAIAVLAACQKVEPPPSASSSSDPLDPFVLMIGAERWGVIIDKARDGVREAPGDAQLESDMYRADVALKSGAASLIVLRNEACAKGLVTGAACNLADWPAWTREPPTDRTPIDEIQRRSDWLSEQMDPFTSVGCEAGRKATGDDMFCSVE